MTGGNLHHVSAFACWSAALTIVGAGGLSAQQSVTPRVTVTGIAVDSVHGGYLRDAIVTVVGTNRFGVTDSVGRFRIDSVPAASPVLRLSHAILDTLGVSVTTRLGELKTDGTNAFVLAVPSPTTIVARKCKADDIKRGSSALAGTVLDADTEMPSVGADVVIAWTDVQVGKKSIERTPQIRRGKVREDGSFFVCGIPSDLATGVFAARGKDSTAAIPVDFSGIVATQAFLMPSSAVVASDSARIATGVTLSGVVLGPNGKPLGGARVAVDADQVATLSRPDGTFALSGLRAGTRLASARKIGLLPVELSVNLSRSRPQNVTIRLANSVKVLETVKVVALRDLGLQKVGFTERKNWGNGRFFTPEEIERRNPMRLNYLLEAASMLRSGSTQQGKRYITGRFNGCVRYFIDGWMQAEISPTDLENLPDSYLSTAELGAVEVYSPFTVPGQFMAISRSGQVCSSVVIWTKFKIGVR